MTKHKHAEMIKAKADNMRLTVFAKSLRWHEVFSDDFGFFDSNSYKDYFICLPQHKEACLHWLNGGEIQDKFEGEWTFIKPHNGNPNWYESDQKFMNEEYEFRIKPKTEIRYAAYDPEEGLMKSFTFQTEEMAENHYSDRDVQIVKIEVEVER